jgi:hypothetical protein
LNKKREGKALPSIQEDRMEPRKMSSKNKNSSPKSAKSLSVATYDTTGKIIVVEGK